MLLLLDNTDWPGKSLLCCCTLYSGDGVKCFKGNLLPIHTYLCCARIAASLTDNVVICEDTCGLLKEHLGSPLTEMYRPRYICFLPVEWRANMTRPINEPPSFFVHIQFYM
jgi:hypothetical protein